MGGGEAPIMNTKNDKVNSRILQKNLIETFVMFAMTYKGDGKAILIIAFRLNSCS